MTDALDPLSDFADLRRAGIDYAQQASGGIWTDYNLHDPGVTLLEQTCFALSQIAYQVGLPTRDLLTNPRGNFCFADLALFKPRQVLGTDPVTRHDLAAWLCSCPEVDSVTITPPRQSAPGLYSITIVPSQRGERLADPETAFRESFSRIRPLCTDLEQVEIARPVDVQLFGQIEINTETLPETAAAELYQKIAHILTGSDRDESPASRADVWDAPERLLAPSFNRSAQSLDLGRYLSQLRSLPGIRDIGKLWLRPITEQRKDAETPVYFRLLLPKTDADLKLTLSLNDAPVTVHVTRLYEEALRIGAETIAEATHHIDRIDWDVMKPGRTRSFTLSHVDSLLPDLFRAQGYRMHDPSTLVAEYRSAIDDVLRAMVQTVATLPDRFTAAPEGDQGNPVIYRSSLDLLDYLIALQGAEMPATRHSGLHHYMTSRARHRFEVEWRLEYLFALPALNRSRATGPGPRTPGGFLAELAILCDLDLSEDGDLSKPLRDYGLSLDPTAEMLHDAEAERFPLIPAHNPFDMLVPETVSTDVLDRDALADLSPFLAEGVLAPRLLAHLSQPDSFAVAPFVGGQWLILLDPGNGAPLRRIGTAAGKPEAQETVARLRATWRYINRQCESAHLVEHILLRPVQTESTDIADLILPGWTARCQMQSYRSYVQARVLALAPAHVYIRIHWLDFSQMREFETLKAASLAGGKDARCDLYDHLNTLAVEGKA